MPMKVAMFLNAFPEISETFILNQITGLIDRGHQVDIYAIRPGDTRTVHAAVARYGLLDLTTYLGAIPKNYILRGIRAVGLLAKNRHYLDPGVLLRSLDIRKHGRAASSLSILFNCVPLLKKRTYDIVHCQFGTLGPPVLRLKQIGAVSGKLITSFRGYDATKYLLRRPGVYDELFREADLLLTVSRSLMQVLIAAGCPGEKIRVHHSGIDCSAMEPVDRHTAGAGPLEVISVARLVEKKGIGYAVRAVSRMLSAGRKLRYTVVGDGPLRGALERLIRELGMNENVRLAGWMNHSDALALMRNADVLLAPSITTDDGDQEGIPNVIKEALALGLPVISTRHSGIPELIEHGMSGLLVPERDVEALVNGLSYVVEHPDRAASLGRRGRLRVAAEYDGNALNDRLVKIYGELVGQRTLPAPDGAVCASR